MLSKVYKNQNIFTKDYIFEPKLDGYRALCYKNSSLRFISRNGNDLTQDFPELQTPKNIKAKTAVIDGEIVIYNKKGYPDFNLIQNRQTRRLPAFFVAFDILMKNEKDLTTNTLLQRKAVLERTFLENNFFQLLLYTEKGEQLLEQIKKHNLEGMMIKKKDSSYQQGRSADWLKLKLVKTIDCVILGYTTQKKEISSLLLGLYQKDELAFVGKVGTGFNEKNLEELKDLFRDIKTEKYLDVKEKATWLKPVIVAEIKFTEMTNDKRLRAPVFIRVRPDKKHKECGFDQL